MKDHTHRGPGFHGSDAKRKGGEGGGAETLLGKPVNDVSHKLIFKDGDFYICVSVNEVKPR